LKVKVDSEEVAPSAENIKSGKYLLSRDLYFYLRNKPSGEAKAFIDFVLSPEGQQIVTKTGYFPVK
jgi:phosphate transport system substrate-binding protein